MLMNTVMQEKATTELSPISLKPNARDRAILCARIAEDYRGRNVMVLDVRKILDWTDFLVLGTGGSRRQLVAAADEIDRRLAELGDRKYGAEGYNAGGWVVLDYGDVVVHLFDDAKRAYYQLESLWEDAPRVAWERDPSAESSVVVESVPELLTEAEAPTS